MVIRTKYWQYRDQEEKNLLRGEQQTIFNDIMELRSVIGKQEKEITRDDYVGTIWEGVCMANKVYKKG